MAIGAGNAGTWAVNNATTQTVTLPTHAAGTQLILIAACKAATPASVSISVTTPATGWDKIGQFADGTTASGNGTGSVTCAIFRRICTSSSETNPVVTWGGSQTATPGIAVANGFTKGASEVWLIPALVQAATTNATSISVTMGSNPGITAGDWGLGIHTTRDDSALTVPTWTATSATLAAVVVYPTTPIADGTSNDMAGTACYRSVTSGTASAAPVVTGTQAAAETGVTSFVRLRVAAEAPQTVTPSTASLALSTFAPTVIVPNNITVTPGKLSLTLATFVPTIQTPILVTPALATLTLAPFAPTVTVATTVVPATASLGLTTFEPTVTVEAQDITVTPGTASLALTTNAPTVALSDNQRVTPGTVALSAVTFAPTVSATNHQTVIPGVATLTATRFAPTVTASDHQTVVPATRSLTLSTFAPVVAAGVRAVPDTASLTTSAFAPTITITQNQRITPSTAQLAMTAFAPNIVISDHKLVTPATKALTLTGYAPDVDTHTTIGLPAFIVATISELPPSEVSVVPQGPAATVRIIGVTARVSE